MDILSENTSPHAISEFKLHRLGNKMGDYAYRSFTKSFKIPRDKHCLPSSLGNADKFVVDFYILVTTVVGDFKRVCIVL